MKMCKCDLSYLATAVNEMITVSPQAWNTSAIQSSHNNYLSDKNAEYKTCS